MDTDDIVRVIKRKNPVPPKPRAAMGQWVPPAHAVVKLVSAEGWTVSAAVRQVVAALNLHPPGIAFDRVRAAYYAIRKKGNP